MKKYLVIFIVSILCMGMCACSGEKENDASLTYKQISAEEAKEIMDTDFSWGTSARKYYMLYERM